MPNVKISELPAASTPLTGTEVVPVVQGGVTEQVTVANLTAGRAVSASALTSSTGDLTFTGTGQRIRGDMSNLTFGNRLAFQSSTTNGNTSVFALPNGAGVNSSFQTFNNSDPSNAAVGVFGIVGATDVRIQSGITGAGTYLPMTLYTGGSEKLRIAADATGTYTFGGTTPRITGDMSNATASNRLAFQTSTVNGNTGFYVIPNGSGTTAGLTVSNSSAPDNSSLGLFQATSTEIRIIASAIGSGTNLPMTFYTGGSERVRITTTGNIIAGASAALSTTATDGFLYVPTCAGTPTGVPTAITGMAPIVVNTTNNKLYFYSGGAWRDAGP